MPKCRVCPAEIEWVKLDTGKHLPIDAQPDDAGNVAVKRDGFGLFGYVTSETKPLANGFRLAMPHHATCPGWKWKADHGA